MGVDYVGIDRVVPDLKRRPPAHATLTNGLARSGFRRLDRASRHRRFRDFHPKQANMLGTAS